MAYQISKVAVLGAGVMGAAIAAHLANVGIPSLLLDIVPPDAGKDRDKIARTGLEKALKARPAAFYSQRFAKLVTTGNIEDDLPALTDVDWIIEAVVERLDIKQQLYTKLEQVMTPGAIITSNTSGLPVHLLTGGRSADFRRHFLIMHFFNPVRYMRLLEIVPGVDTDPELVQYMQQFATEVLGKGVVLCKDTPNFIANRIGVYSSMSTLRRALDEGYTVGEVDAILGPIMGRPRSAVFRTADLSGLDTLVNVADNLYQNAPGDPWRETFRVPEVVLEMVRRGWLGEKSGQGFYKRIKNPDGESTILELNLKTLEYEPQQKVRFPSLGASRNINNPVQRLLTVLDADDRAAQLARETTADALIYAASLVPQIADSIIGVDQAMRWGFDFDMGTYGPVPIPGGAISLAEAQARGNVLRDTGSASLIDLGDDIACVEFHTKMNAIDESIIEMLRYVVEEGKKQFRALIIGNEADDFSAGANILLMLMGAKQGEWKMLEGAINAFQQVNQLLKYAPIPVVAAPAGRALGGGCEVVMHSAHARAAAETYIGQVEVGLGLVPGGGGCKELLLRHGASVEDQKARKTGGPFTPARRAFEIIAFATVSTSAVEAQELRFLRKSDAISVNRDLLLRDAKADAIRLAEAQSAGKWQPVQAPLLLLPGPGARMVLEQQIDNLLLLDKVSEHDAVIGRHLARVLTGGECSPTIPLTEQQVLDLEREAFLSLCSMEKTQDRMQAFLTTGKPLR